MGTYDATKPVAGCAKGEVKLTVRNWNNKHTADSKYGLDYNCLVCGTTCTPTKSLTTPGTTVCAALKADVKGTIDLNGSGSV